MNVWMQARIIVVLMPTVLIPLEAMSVPVYLDILVMAFFVVVSTKSQFQLYNGCMKILTKAFFSDVDECADGNDSCHSNASCSNVIGSYNCDCFPGFTGDGFSCSSKYSSTVQLHTLGTFPLLDINECADMNGNNCSVYANCTDTIGSYDCTCSAGYTADGYLCDGMSIYLPFMCTV